MYMNMKRIITVTALKQNPMHGVKKIFRAAVFYTILARILLIRCFTYSGFQKRLLLI